MGNFFFIITLLNLFFVSFIFWIITFFYNLTSVFFKNKEKVVVYECGFLTINKLCLSFLLNSVVLCLFLLVYEFEFVTLIPLFFNLFSNFFFVKIYLFFFFSIVAFTTVLDVFFKETNWVY